MEIRIESLLGTSLPPGCHVTVRMGDVLKQSRYDPGRVFSFPAPDRRRNAKIDLYQHIGTCSVPVDAGTTKLVNEVSVNSSEPMYEGMRLKVNIDSNAVGPIKPSRKDRVSAVKIEAKEYLDHHGIEERLSDAVKTLLKVRPADPWDFIIGQLRASKAKMSTGAQQRPGVSKLAPFYPYYSRNFLQTKHDAALARFPPKWQPPPPPTQLVEQELRKKAAESMLKASQNGDLTTAIQVAKTLPSDVSKLRQKAVSALVDASFSGELDSMIQDAKQQCRGVAKENTTLNLKDQAGQDAEVAVLSKAQNLRAEARTLFTEAAANGKLGELVHAVRPPLPDDLESLRITAQKSLLQAAASGVLQGSLQAMSPPVASKAVADTELDLLRLKAKNALAEASSCVTLEQADGTMSVFREDDLDGVRQKARAALLEAASEDSSNKLLDSNIPGSQRSLEEVRNRTAEKLITACGDGELEKVIASISAEQGAHGSSEDIRSKARDLLMETCTNGRLQQAILKVEATKACDTHDLRSKTARTLQDSLATGALADALSSMAQK